MLNIKEKAYQLTEIEAETLSYEEALTYAQSLQEKGFVVDMQTVSKKGNEKTSIHVITGSKKVPCS